MDVVHFLYHCRLLTLGTCMRVMVVILCVCVCVCYQANCYISG